MLKEKKREMTVLESEYPLQGYQMQFCSKFYFLIQVEVGLIFHESYEHGIYGNILCVKLLKIR